MIKKLLALVVVVVVAAGAAFWWFVLRTDAPEELSLDSGSGGTTEAPATTGTAPETLDGTWTVQEGGDTTAGFRIGVSYASGLVDHTAVGRSTGVTGSMVLAGTDIVEGSFTVDMTAIEFTDDPGLPVARRANAIRTQGLETDRFPEATFELTEPIAFGSLPAEGETITATATGELTLHGVTRPVSFEVEARLAGGTIRVVTAETVPVVLADHDIAEPQAPVVASVADEGAFEFLIELSR
jgi:polyisoprenoid-binding protein YceI